MLTKLDTFSLNRRGIVRSLYMEISKETKNGAAG